MPFSDGDTPTPKKKKAAYKVPKEAEELIKSDKANKKLWDECLQFVKEGQQVSLNPSWKLNNGIFLSAIPVLCLFFVEFFLFLIWQLEYFWYYCKAIFIHTCIIFL